MTTRQLIGKLGFVAVGIVIALVFRLPTPGETANAQRTPKEVEPSGKVGDIYLKGSATLGTGEQFTYAGPLQITDSNKQLVPVEKAILKVLSIPLTNEPISTCTGGTGKWYHGGGWEGASKQFCYNVPKGCSISAVWWTTEFPDNAKQRNLTIFCGIGEYTDNNVIIVTPFEAGQYVGQVSGPVKIHILYTGEDPPKSAT